MKVTLTKDPHDYFTKLLGGTEQQLIEAYQDYIDKDLNISMWGELYNKVANKVGFSSAQMVAKLFRGEIEIKKEAPTRFVFYKKQGSKRRYYGALEEVKEGIKATWYDTRLSFDKRQMKALEQLNWTKISLEQAIEDDKNK